MLENAEDDDEDEEAEERGKVAGSEHQKALTLDVSYFVGFARLLHFAQR